MAIYLSSESWSCSLTWFEKYLELRDELLKDTSEDSSLPGLYSGPVHPKASTPTGAVLRSDDVPASGWNPVSCISVRRIYLLTYLSNRDSSFLPSFIVFLGTLENTQISCWKSKKGDKARLFTIYLLIFFFNFLSLVTTCYQGRDNTVITTIFRFCPWSLSFPDGVLEQEIWISEAYGIVGTAPVTSFDENHWAIGPHWLFDLAGPQNFRDKVNLCQQFFVPPSEGPKGWSRRSGGLL